MLANKQTKPTVVRKWLKVKVFGFTLAEVLITLGIIGIIATTMIPSVINEINKQQFKSGCQNTMATLNGAVTQLASDNGGLILTNLPTHPNNFLSNNYLGKYLKFAKYCPSESAYGSCWHDEANGVLKTLNGYNYFWHNWEGAILENGTLLHIDFDVWWEPTPGDPSPIIYEMVFDVNGFKGPNRVGKDVFFATVLNDGRVMPGVLCYKDCGTPELNYPPSGQESINENCSNTCSSNGGSWAWACGVQCAAKIMKGDTIDWY